MALHLQDPCGSLLRLNLFIDDASRLNQDRQTMEEIRKILLEEKEKIGQEFKSRQINQFNVERDVGDEVDNSVVEQERELNLLLQQHLLHLTNPSMYLQFVLLTFLEFEVF